MTATEAETVSGSSVEVAAPPRTGLLILMRHGETLFNREEIFTGWCDVPLTAQGRDEVRVPLRLTPTTTAATPLRKALPRRRPPPSHSRPPLARRRRGAPA